MVKRLPVLLTACWFGNLISFTNARQWAIGKPINTGELIGKIIVDGTDVDREQIKTDKIESAMLKVFKEGKVRTREIGGAATTDAFADAIVVKMS